jgi:hypothetical protein
MDMTTSNPLTLREFASKLMPLYYEGVVPKILIGMKDKNFRNRILLFTDTCMIIGDNDGVFKQCEIDPSYRRLLTRLYDASELNFYDYVDTLDSLYNRYWIEKFNCCNELEDLYNTLFNFMTFCNEEYFYTPMYCIYYWKSFFHYVSYMINNMSGDEQLIHKSTLDKLNVFLSTVKTNVTDYKLENRFYFRRHEPDILLKEYYSSDEVKKLFFM